MTTRVFRARQASAVGVNGFYDIEFSGTGCDLDITVTKTGYTGNGKLRLLLPEKQKRGRARVRFVPKQTASGEKTGEFVAKVELDLARPDGSAVQSIALMLWKDSLGLQGLWAYEKESWEKTEMAGSLVATRTLLHPPHLMTGDDALYGAMRSSL